MSKVLPKLSFQVSTTSKGTSGTFRFLTSEISVRRSGEHVKSLRIEALCTSYSAVVWMSAQMACNSVTVTVFFSAG